MRYQDLLEKAKQLPAGKHVLYDLETGKVVLQNLGVRHFMLSNRPEYRLVLETGNKQIVPRHSDFFTDFLLKLDAQPDTRLAMNDACEAVCNEGNPVELLAKHKFPKHFSREGEDNWTLQTTSYQTAGLSTELLFCGLQAMIIVAQLNDPNVRAPEAFRKVFVDLSHGIPLFEAARHLRPQPRPGKRYFDKLDRTPLS